MAGHIIHCKSCTYMYVGTFSQPVENMWRTILWKFSFSGPFYELPGKSPLFWRIWPRIKQEGQPPRGQLSFTRSENLRFLDCESLRLASCCRKGFSDAEVWHHFRLWKAGKVIRTSQKSLSLKTRQRFKSCGLGWYWKLTLADWNPMSWWVSSHDTGALGSPCAQRLGHYSPLESLNSWNHPCHTFIIIHSSIFLNSLHISEIENLWDVKFLNFGMLLFFLFRVLKPATPTTPQPQVHLGSMHLFRRWLQRFRQMSSTMQGLKGHPVQRFPSKSRDRFKQFLGIPVFKKHVLNATHFLGGSNNANVW